jgi:hypothetical protein
MATPPIGREFRRATTIYPVRKGETMISSKDYVQPIASHSEFPERLLLRDEMGDWSIWFGDGREMETLPTPLAEWMVSRPEMIELHSPALWFDSSSLPVSGSAI